MTRRFDPLLVTIFAVTAAVLVIGLRSGTSVLVAQSSSPHAYFDAMIARPDHWKHYSLRDPKQLDYPKNGGYAHGNAGGLWVTYNAGMDAAAVRVPTFVDVGTTLASPMTTTDTVLHPRNMSVTDTVVNRLVKVDGEVMNIVDRDLDNVTITVTRGMFGTPVTAHATGAVFFYSNTSLPNQVWLPMGTEDGHTYLTTWDAWYPQDMTKDLVGFGAWKEFQFRRVVNSPSIWFEVRSRFDLAPAKGDVGTVDTRGYITLGPNVTKDQPLSPQVNQFVLKPGTWTRYWMFLDQRANDWDRISFWVADEQHDPVQILNGIQMETSNGEGTATVDSFQLEFNSGQRLTRLRSDWIVYVRDVVMLKDIKDPTTVFARPVPGAVPTGISTLTPSSPSNVRIIK